MMFFLFIWAMCSLGFFALASSMAKHQNKFSVMNWISKKQSSPQ